MIVIEQKNEVLTVHVYSELSLDDFKEFENAVNDELKQYDHVNLLLDLSSMTRFSVDVALEELRFSKEHSRDYEKIAVITESQWLAWASWLAAAFVSADVRQFDTVESATAWLTETAGSTSAPNV